MFRFLRSAREKITPIDLTNPDAVVTVTNTRYYQSPFDSDYRGCCIIQEGYLTSVCFQTLDRNDMLYEQPHSCYIYFSTPKAYPHTLWPGRKIELYEGKYLVGIIVIEKIINTILDRDIKFDNQEDILSNYKILNIALKRSLEWGKNFKMPLDNKLMKSIPTLSGRDIEKASEYVIQVRNDVIWKIYYQNWDAEKQNLKIDAEKTVSEKYPWINKNNLISLNSQGMYYVWHG